MKKLCGLVVFLLLLVPALFAQEHYTEVHLARHLDPREAHAHG